MLRSILSLTVAAIALMSVGQAYAQNSASSPSMAPGTGALETYKLDKPHTQILFKVNHLGFTDSYGKFLDYDGTFTLDRAAPEKSSANVTIQVGSLEMGDAKWNEHLKSADFFNVEKFPTMTFKTTSVEKTGENTANVTGDFTMLGVTKPVTLKVTHNKSGVFPMDDKMYIAGFSATGTLKRSEFGMGKYVPMVGDDITLMIEVQGDQENYKGPDKGKE
jgi:polyisoprenoid-binding protein YceI